MSFVKVLLLLHMAQQVIGYNVLNCQEGPLDLNDTVFDSKDDNWWQTSSFYQIYPRSFKDSNADGIGDLNGITENLDYLKELGINATWLSPIYKSPMADFGYDISDFFSIQPEYGTMEDFEKLLAQAKSLGIRIIMDFVPNHSSDENAWFVKSENKEPQYKDFYIWHPGYPDPNNSTNRLPPSNWISFFWHSAWQWSAKRQEFYLHQFHRKQPDLNYRNPFVVETMKSVLKFWLDKGVNGFRIDAVPTLFELLPDAEGRYKDEPRSGYTNNTDDPSYLLHVYTQDQPETLDMVYQWREVLDQHQRDHGGERRVMLTESYSKIEILMKYYGDGAKREGSNIPFDFLFIMNLNNQSNANDVKGIVDLWMENMPKGRTANWVWGNHDQKRVASRMNINRIDGLNIIDTLLPGVSITYYGEEIGMTDVWISWNDTVDPAACNTNPQVYEQYSRDPARTPMQWDDSKNSGFSKGETTWLPLSPSFTQVNVKLQKDDEKSHLNVFKELMKLRQNDIIKSGSLDMKVVNSTVILIKREMEGGSSLIATINWNEKLEKINLKSIWNHFPKYLEVRIAGHTSDRHDGDVVSSDEIFLLPYESLVLLTRYPYYN